LTPNEQIACGGVNLLCPDFSVRCILAEHILASVIVFIQMFVMVVRSARYKTTRHGSVCVH
jgi:hypothetical protein